MDGETPGFSKVSALLLTCSMASMVGINRVIFSPGNSFAMPVLET